MTERTDGGYVVEASERSSMARNAEKRPARGAAKPKRLASAARKGRRIVRTLAQGTLLAAGIAVTHLGVAEIDSRYQIFDRTLVDRLEAPITRYHE